VALVNGEAEAELRALILSEAVRTMRQQQAVIDALMQRSATLLAALAIATSFLGSVALDAPSPLTAAGIGCFVIATFAIVAVLWPRDGWVFSFETKKLASRYIDGDRKWTLPEVHADLADEWVGYIDANQAKIDELMRLFAAGALTAALVILFLVLAVIL
jgi:hypothetical protein